MIGAIIGDVIGSVFEFSGTNKKDFDLFCLDSEYTDDTVLTIATIDAILNSGDYSKTYKEYAKNYPNRGYGNRFRQWYQSEDSEPYNSFGNGSAMRVSPIGWLFNNIDNVLKEAKKSAEVTHNHPEGIKGAQAVAAAIFLARTGKSKENIRDYIENKFEYDLSMTIDEVRKISKFNETCMVSVPEAIIAFLDSTSFEDAIRNAISLKADADTQACIVGSIAEAFYGEIPEDIKEKTFARLPKEFISKLDEFYKLYVK